MKHPQVSTAILVLIIFNIFIFNGLAQVPPFKVIPERTWSELFIALTEDAPYSDNNKKPFTYAVKEFSKNIISDVTDKLNNGQVSGKIMDQVLIGYLITCYYLNLTPRKNTNSWTELHNTYVQLRTISTKLGLDSYVLENSFNNMNEAARMLALPTAENLY